MARIRTIKPDFFTSEDIMALSPLARLLYIGTWLDADREGRLTWKPATLKVRYLPSDACDVAAVARELTDRGLIVLYGDGLAFIPRFADHQIVNPREGKSKLPEPSEGEISRVTNASLRVSDAPSFPSLPVPSIPSKVQGVGAFEPGSLPRDHMRHAVCGPSMRVCLKTWEFSELAKQFNNPDQAATRAAIVEFVEHLERSGGPIGTFKNVEAAFCAWLQSTGQSPADLKPKQKPFSIQEVLDREAAKKAGRAS